MGKQQSGFNPSDVARYRKAYAAGEMSSRDIMVESGMSMNTVGRMLRAETYQEVPERVTSRIVRQVGNALMEGAERLYKIQESGETEADRSLKRLIARGVQIPQASEPAPAPQAMTESEAKALIGPIPEPVEWEGGNPLDEME